MQLDTESLSELGVHDSAEQAIVLGTQRLILDGLDARRERRDHATNRNPGAAPLGSGGLHQPSVEQGALGNGDGGRLQAGGESPAARDGR